LIKDIHRQPSQTACFMAIIFFRCKIPMEMASLSTLAIAAISPFDISAE
jgi:hypothetical protein